MQAGSLIMLYTGTCTQDIQKKKKEEKKMNKGQWGSLGIGVLAGSVVGGVVALLFAPKSGKDTRAFFKEKAGDIKDKVGEKTGDIKDKVGEKVSTIRHNMGDKISGDGEHELVLNAKK
jgi:gas vesicle protein